MKTIKYYLLVFVAISVLGCKSEPNLNLIYSKQEKIFNCDSKTPEDIALINEAIHTFEKDLLAGMMVSANTNPRLDRAYSGFVQRNINAASNEIVKDMISQHAIDVFNELKKTDIFDSTQKGEAVFNQNSSFVNCIINNLSEGQMKQTVTSLKKVGDLTPRMFAFSVTAQNSGASAYMNNDIKAFIALSFYYARFFEIDFKEFTPKANATHEPEDNGPKPAPSSGNQVQ